MRLVDAPDNDVLVEFAIALAALSKVPTGSRCTLYLNKKMILQIMLGSAADSLHWNIPDELRVAFRQAVSQRLVDFDIVDFKPTPRRDRLIIHALDAAQQGIVRTNQPFDDFLASLRPMKSVGASDRMASDQGGPADDRADGIKSHIESDSGEDSAADYTGDIMADAADVAEHPGDLPLP